MKEFMKTQKQRRINQMKQIETDQAELQRLKKQRLKQLSMKQRELVAKSVKHQKRPTTNSDLYEPTTNDIEEVIQNVGIAAEQAKNVMQQYYGSLDSSFQKEPVLDISKSTEASTQSIRNKTKRLVAIESGAPGPRPGSLNSSFLEELNEPINTVDTKSAEILNKNILQDLSDQEDSKRGPSNDSKNFLNVDMQKRIQSYVDQISTKLTKTGVAVQDASSTKSSEPNCEPPEIKIDPYPESYVNVTQSFDNEAFNRELEAIKSKYTATENNQQPWLNKNGDRDSVVNILARRLRNQRKLKNNQRVEVKMSKQAKHTESIATVHSSKISTRQNLPELDISPVKKVERNFMDDPELNRIIESKKTFDSGSREPGI